MCFADEYFYGRKRPGDDNAIIAGLAPAINKDVMNHLLSQTVCRVPFFYVPALGSRNWARRRRSYKQRVDTRY